MKTFTKLEIGLENCEVITIPVKNVKVSFDVVSQSVITLDSEIFERVNVDNVKLHLNSNFKYNPFNQAGETTVFDRLTEHNDITSLTFKYADGTYSPEYRPIYSEDENSELGEENEYQSVEYKTEDELIINIKKV